MHLSGRVFLFLRRISQFFFFALFLYFFSRNLATDFSTPFFANPFLWFDPFLNLALTLTGSLSPSGLTGSILLILLTLVLSRFFCGWLCPLGTIFTFIGYTKFRFKITPKLKFIILIVLLLFSIIGLELFAVFDPIVLLNRAFSSLFKFAIYPSLISWGMLIFILSLIFNLFDERVWCRSLCPLGALYAIFAKFSYFSLVGPSEDCRQCSLCTEICPFNALNFANSALKVNTVECVLCGRCVAVCPQRRGWRLVRREAKPVAICSYSVAKRELLRTLSGFLLTVTGASILRQPFGRLGLYSQSSRLSSFILPPGVRHPDKFASRCVRCGECLAICPTQVLRPHCSNWNYFYLPYLAMRSGYCEYKCNRCGAVCPTLAIPRLTLQQKQRTVLGKARIDHRRCFPWSAGINCLVCEEHCPVPGKAISLIRRDSGNSEYGEELLLPVVNSRRCLGCGICEYKCPVEGKAAIRVYLSGDTILS